MQIHQVIENKKKSVYSKYPRTTYDMRERISRYGVTNKVNVMWSRYRPGVAQREEWVPIIREAKAKLKGP